ncbi:MAG: O-methyltransferase [Microbacter sp.]
MDDLEHYILQHLDREDELLNRLYRETHLTQVNPRMAAGHLQGSVLTMFCKMIRPKRILEIGTFTGYATLCMAAALPAEGEIHTIELDDELEPVIQRYLSQSPHRHKIHLHIGNSLTVIPSLTPSFDLAYLDGDKRQLIDDYEALLPLVPCGGFIIADNTLWGGKVIRKTAPNDKQTIGVQQFNDHIAHDGRIEKAIIPMRDGMTLIMKK